MKLVDRWWLISQKGNLCVSDESFSVDNNLSRDSWTPHHDLKRRTIINYYTLPSAELVFFSVINQSSQLKVNGADSRQ